MKEPRWVTKAIVLAIHERLLAEHGGRPGKVHDERLEGALDSAKNQFHYERVTVFTLAAAYAHAILRDHPFIDGNKRVALTVAGVFLGLNGYRLGGSEHDAAHATDALADRRLDQAGYAAWLEASSTKATARRRRR